MVMALSVIPKAQAGFSSQNLAFSASHGSLYDSKGLGRTLQPNSAVWDWSWLSLQFQRLRKDFTVKSLLFRTAATWELSQMSFFTFCKALFMTLVMSRMSMWSSAP